MGAIGHPIDDHHVKGAPGKYLSSSIHVSLL